MALYMVIERFRSGGPEAVGARFRAQGRMMPEGVEYVASWMDPASARCFQVMRAPEMALLQKWIDCWSDLVAFEVIPVVTSQEYWGPPEG